MRSPSVSRGMQNLHVSVEFVETELVIAAQRIQEYERFFSNTDTIVHNKALVTNVDKDHNIGKAFR